MAGFFTQLSLIVHSALKLT